MKLCCAFEFLVKRVETSQLCDGFRDAESSENILMVFVDLYNWPENRNLFEFETNCSPYSDIWIRTTRPHYSM